jgi:nitrite reductase/ring-hydroxylating ferredoxin subunit
MEKIFVSKTEDVLSGQMKKISIDGNEIVILNINGSYFAIDDTCTHAGGSLSEGKLDGSTIICDWHGAQFECKNGKLLKFPAKINDLKSYKIVIESDKIFVET